MLAPPYKNSGCATAHVGAIPPGKSYGENIEINEQNKKLL